MEDNNKISPETKVYGYVRVSSTDQNEDRQMLEMQRLKIKKKNIYIMPTE